MEYAPMRIFLIGIAVLILVYILVSYRVSDREIVEFEIRLLGPNESLRADEVVTVSYNSHLPVPILNMSWAHGWILPTYNAKGAYREYRLKEFLPDPNANSVVLKVPAKIAGIGDYRMGNFRFRNVDSPSILKPEQNNLRSSYIVKENVLLRILSPQIRFSFGPDTTDYFLDESGTLLQNPYTDPRIQTDLERVHQIVYSTKPRSIIEKVKAHQFFRNQNLKLISADQFANKEPDLQIFEIKTEANSEGFTFSYQYVFRNGKMLRFFWSKVDEHGGADVEPYGFVGDELVYAERWSPIAELDDREDAKFKPDDADIEQIKKDFAFLKSFLM